MHPILGLILGMIMLIITGCIGILADKAKKRLKDWWRNRPPKEARMKEFGEDMGSWGLRIFLWVAKIMATSAPFGVQEPPKRRWWD